MASTIPLPTNLKVLRGTAIPCRINEKEPRPKKLKTISPPSFLSKEEKKCWREVVTELQKCGIVTTIDKQALVAYCKCWVAWINRQKIIEIEGSVTTGCLGNEIVSPHVRVANDIFKQLLSLWQQFGMTPASRSRIHAEKDEDDDDYATRFQQQKERQRIAREGI